MPTSFLTVVNMFTSNSSRRHCQCTTQNKYNKISDFNNAPSFLKFNPFITNGYRHKFNYLQCLKSIFYLTNESVNIWTHLFGFLYFFQKSFNIDENIKLTDQYISLFVLIAFQACMLLSSLYHIFCCSSSKSYHGWLKLDLFGVSLSLLAIYLSGIYYAFHNNQFWLKIYVTSVVGIFIIALLLSQLSNEEFHLRLFVFAAWAAYGVIPTIHHVFIHGFQHQHVQLLLPRIIIMYILSISAFTIYILRIPERIIPGRFNYFGSSHQIWHCLIFCALLHWQNTGDVFNQFIN